MIPGFRILSLILFLTSFSSYSQDIRLSHLYLDQEKYNTPDSLLGIELKNEFLDEYKKTGKKLNQSSWQLMESYVFSEDWEMLLLVSEEIQGSFTNTADSLYVIASLYTYESLRHLGNPNEAALLLDRVNESLGEADFSASLKEFFLLTYAQNLLQRGAYGATGKIVHSLGGSVNSATQPIQSLYYWVIGNYQMALNDLPAARKSVMKAESTFQPVTKSKVIGNDLALLKAELYLRAGNFIEFDSLMEGLNNLPVRMSQTQKSWFRSLQFFRSKEGALSRANLERNVKGVPVYFKIYEYLAESHYYFDAGNYGSSIQTLGKAQKLIRQHYSQEHPLYHDWVVLMAKNHWKNKDINRSLTMFRKASKLQLIQYTRYFSFLTEKEKERFYDANRDFENLYGEFAIDVYTEYPKVASDLMNHLLVFKGMLFNDQKEIREKIYREKELSTNYKRYIRLQEELQIVLESNERNLVSFSPRFIDSLYQEIENRERLLSLHSFLNSKEKMSDKMALDWIQVRDALPEHSVMLQILRVETSLSSSNSSIRYIYLGFQRKSRSVSMFVSEDDIEKYSVLYRNTIKYRLKENRVYEAIWRPVEQHLSLQDSKKIYLVPDGMYNLINLSTLYNGDEEKYLAESQSFIMLGNAKDLLQRKRVQNENMNKVFIMAFPEYDSKGLLEASNDEDESGIVIPATEEGLSDEIQFQEVLAGMRSTDRSMFNSKIAALPGTKKEADRITALLDSMNYTYEEYTEKEADENRLKSVLSSGNAPDVIHIATHGYFDALRVKDGGDPLQNSGLLFSGAQYAFNDSTIRNLALAYKRGEIKDNGVLIAKEAMYLELLATDLVILSACETGTGSVKAGEGVYGLHRAFQSAGAQSVLMSLWKVDDEATNDFMYWFYKEWANSRDKEKAFLMARDKTREKYKDPYFWGAFNLVGI